MVPVPSLAGTGPIDPYVGLKITSQLVQSFFDKHLKGLPQADPIQIGAAYGSLELQVFQGASVD